MVRITDRSRSVEDIEERLYGTDTREECKVILEMFGIVEGIEQTAISKADDTFDNIEITPGIPFEIEFKDKRADYQDIRNYAFFMEQYLANHHAGYPITAFRLERMIKNGETKEMVDRLGDGSLRAMREFEAYMKPHEDINRIYDLNPRPKIVFELHYDVPRGAELKSAYRDMQEQIDDNLMGNIGEIELLEDRGVIMLIPLKSVFDIDDYNSIDFNMGGIAEEVAADMTGVDLGTEPRLERTIVTCTEVEL